MITAIQAEMLKLRTIRLPFVLLATAAGLTALVAILGATQAGSSPATATATYLATPRRTAVLIAKTVTAALAGLVFGVVTIGVATGTALAFIAAKGYPVALGGATIARFAAGSMLGAGLLAAVGAGIGSLIRSQLAAIITVLAWGIVVEQLIGGLFSSITRYLPFRAATSMAGAELGGGTHPLPFAAAAALVAGVAVLLSAVASRTIVRQDIL